MALLLPRWILALAAAGLAVPASAQTITVLPASRIELPAATKDGNSPGVWQDGELNVYTSTGQQPSRMSGSDIANLSMAHGPYVFPTTHYPLWIESVWKDPEDGLTYAWYHHEARACSDKLAVPSIGALVSYDGGVTFEDLGIVLESGDPVNCNAKNGFFATGNGDFSVVLDQSGEYFYFFFTNYGGPAANQGIAIARMAFGDRAEPLGKVMKFHDGEWNEPGIGGTVTPVFPARVSWAESNADSHWGPAVHWNTSIERYVMLLNRACCRTNWPQEGIYATLTDDLSNPYSWRMPEKILDDSAIGFAPGYYPQVFGIGEGETDTVAGAYPRLFIKGISNWELAFDYVEPDPEPPDPEENCIGGPGGTRTPGVKPYARPECEPESDPTTKRPKKSYLPRR